MIKARIESFFLGAPRDDFKWTQFEMPRKCYICKKYYSKCHPFYCSLCPECAVFNFAKRSSHDNVDLSDCVALVTGARVKIGMFFLNLPFKLASLSTLCTTDEEYIFSISLSWHSQYVVKNRIFVFGQTLTWVHARIGYRSVYSVNEAKQRGFKLDAGTKGQRPAARIFLRGSLSCTYVPTRAALRRIYYYFFLQVLTHVSKAHKSPSHM